MELIGYENVGSGLVTAMVKGDVGAVNAAVESGVEAAKRIGTVVTSRVIARPHNDIERRLQSNIKPDYSGAAKKKRYSAKFLTPVWGKHGLH